MKRTYQIPDRDTLSAFMKKGRSVDWIAEKWSVTPQTVRAWFSRFQIHLPSQKGVKTQYQWSIPEKIKECPVCQSPRSVNYIVDMKHWYCITCEVEYDQHHVIYVYDEAGTLVEVIGQKPGFWNAIRFGRGTSKTLIKTVTV